RNVRIRPDLIDEVHELVRSESVRLDHAAPVRIERDCTLVGWPNSVPPVVFVGKASAGPAHVRHLNRLQRGDDIVANSASVRNRGVRAHPDSLVDAMSKMFRELSEKVAINL